MGMAWEDQGQLLGVEWGKPIDHGPSYFLPWEDEGGMLLVETIKSCLRRLHDNEVAILSECSNYL